MRYKPAMGAGVTSSTLRPSIFASRTSTRVPLSARAAAVPSNRPTSKTFSMIFMEIESGSYSLRHAAGMRVPVPGFYALRSTTSLRGSAPGMMLSMQILQALAGHVGIDLGSGHIAVTQQHLHHAQIGAMIQQVCSERMPQCVGGHGHGYPSFLCITLDNVPERLTGHVIAAARGEQIIVLLHADNLGACCTQIFLDPGLGFLAYWHQAFAFAFAKYAYHALTHVYLVNTQGHQFG